MNAGLHDAVGLGWRLAMTLAAAAGPVVLGSYDAERHGAHGALGEQQVRGFKQLMYRGRMTDEVIGVVAGLIPNLASRVFGGGDLEQLTIAYPHSGLSEDRFSSLNPKRRDAPRAGARAPNATVTGEDGDTVTLFDLIYNPGGRSWGWRLLGFDGGDRGSHDGLKEALATTREWSWAHPALILADPAATGDADGPDRFFDLDGVAHRAYGLDGVPALVLVRPDGHIAFRGPAGEPDALIGYCRKVAGE